MLFNRLGPTAELLPAVDRQGYSTATPIQQQAILLYSQVADGVRAYGKHVPFRTTVIYGGVSINT